MTDSKLNRVVAVVMAIGVAALLARHYLLVVVEEWAGTDWSMFSQRTQTVMALLVLFAVVALAIAAAGLARDAVR